MRISTIVPVYKAESCLCRCIDSLIAFGGEEIEIILVDDGSPDKSPQLCDEYAGKHDNIRVIHKPNGGVVSARRAGVKLATGEYICFVDSDDSIEAPYFAQFLKAIDEYAPDMVLCDYTAVSNGKRAEHHQPVPAGYYDRERILRCVHPVMLSTVPFYTFGVTPTVWTKCIRKNLVQPILDDLPDQIIFGEDAAITCTALLDAQSVCVIDCAAYLYQDNPTSVTRTYNSRLIPAVVALYDYLQKMAREKNWTCGTQIQQYAVMMTYIVLCNELAYPKYGGSLVTEALQAYLAHPVVRDAIRSGIRATRYPLRYRFLLICLKHDWLPLMGRLIRLEAAKNKLLKRNRKQTDKDDL